MGLFSRKPSASATVPQPPAVSQPPGLPVPCRVTSSDQAGGVLEEVGQIQRAIVGGASVVGVGEELVSRIEGAALFYLESGSDPVIVFDQLIAPISEWGMGRLMDRWVMDSTSREGVAGKEAFDLVCALRDKYQYLNPDNN